VFHYRSNGRQIARSSFEARSVADAHYRINRWPDADVRLTTAGDYLMFDPCLSFPGMSSMRRIP